MTAFGPSIPHAPGTPCPFPEAMGKIITANGDCFGPATLGWFDWEVSGECSDIEAYRLPSDHHAYGPRVSRMGRQPDRWVNAYPDGKNGMDHDDREIAILMGCPNSPGAPIGIWRIYLKENAA